MKINILGVNNKKFYTKQTLIFKTVHGGVDLDDLFDIGIEKEINEKEKKEINEKEKIEKEINEKKGDIKIDNVHIYLEDRISELKEKIYLAGLLNNGVPAIPIYRQHLYGIMNYVIPMKYNLIGDINIPINILDIYQDNSLSDILGLPVDTKLYEDREFQIKADDYFYTVATIKEKYNINEFYIVDLAEFLKPELLPMLKELAINDPFQIQLIYYGFIVKFWPLMTFEVFSNYLTTSDFNDTYPDLALDTKSLSKKYEAEKKILDYKYELISNPKKHAGFSKYNPELIKTNNKSIMAVAIKSANITNVVSSTKINTRNLFELLNTSEIIPIIRLRIYVNGKFYTITKTMAPKMADTDYIQKVYEKVKYRIQLSNYNVVLLVVKIADSDDYIILTLQENGKYNIRTLWEEERQMDFYKLTMIVEKTINPVIQHINNFGRIVFENIRQLELINVNNVEFTSLHMSLFWRVPITKTQFDQLTNLIKSDMESRIIRPMEADPGSLNFYMHKGVIFEEEWDQEYTYLSNAKAKQRWENLFAKGRPVSINYRIADLKIEIQGLREQEFRSFYEYIITFLYRFETDILPSVKSDVKKVDVKSANILKLLKSRDPELYAFKQYGSDVVFSRLCQKEHQPIPYLPEEFALLDEKTKKNGFQYWNFTTKTPIYYVCPNKNFPYLNFLTGHHPKGYCLPCCKKTAPYELEDNSINKKQHVYNVCMEQHLYTEGDTSIDTVSRYIMNYGKPVDIGRISKLPEILDRFLTYNLEDKEIINLSEQFITKDFGFGKKIYLMDLIFKNTRNNKTFEEPVKNYIYHLDEIDLTSTDAINNISNVDLSYPILVYTDKDDIQYIIDGIYKIAKLYLDAKNSGKKIDDILIKVKNVTKKQLEKSVEVSEEDAAAELQIAQARIKKHFQVEGGGIKKPGYYIFGVPQNNANLSNIGAVFAIAVALGLTIEELVQQVIQLLKSNNNYFYILLNGILPQYYGSMSDLILNLQNLFLSENLVALSKFYLWNELFIDICKYLNKYIIVLEDLSIDTTGTSLRSASAIENMDIHLPSHVNHVDDIIPESGGKYEYILLLQRPKKSKTFFASKLYYPIFIFVPQIFFKAGSIEKRIFSYQDEVVKLLRSVIINSIEKKEIITEIDIKTINLFLQHLQENKYQAMLNKAYVNFKNVCYAVELLIDNEYFYFPVQYSYYDGKEKVFTPFQRKNITNYKKYKEIIEEYNNFVVEESEKKGLYKIIEEKTIGNKLNTRENKVTPIYPLIKADRIIVDNHAQKIIGFENKNIYYYFQDVEFSEKNLQKVIKEFISDYYLFASDISQDPIIKHILYIGENPDKVNTTIYEKGKKQPAEVDLSNLSKALYHRYLYQMFVTELIHSLDNERDPEMRKKVFQLVNEEKQKELEKILAEFPADLEIINKQIYIYQTQHMNKKQLLNDLEKFIYDFDKITLLKLRRISDDYKNELYRKEKKLQLVKLITKIAESAIKQAKPDFTKGNFPNNIIELCETSQVYCYRGKLLVDPDRFDELIDAFTNDITNPLKRDYLLNAIINNSVQNYFQFRKNENEELYIQYI